MSKYINHFVVMLGANLTGLLNLVLAFAVFKISTPNEYSDFIAYTSYFVILFAFAQVSKNLSSTYGQNILMYIKMNILATSVISLVFLTLFGILVGATTNFNFVSSFVLSTTALVNIFVLVYIGALQHDAKFKYTSILLFSQNALKLVLVILFAIFLGNTGIWIGYLIPSVLLMTWLIFKDKSTTKSSDLLKINFEDIVINLILFVSIEIFFNLDGIVVQKVMEPVDSEQYNSLILIKKALLMSITSIVPILLSQGRQQDNPSIVSLGKHLGVAIVVSIVLSMLLLLIKSYALDFLNLSNIDLEYANIIIGTVVFGVVLIIAYWFSSFRSKLPRILLIIGIILASICFALSISNLAATINLFVVLSAVLLVYEIGLVYIARMFNLK